MLEVLPEGLIPAEDTKPADAKPSIPKGTIPEGTVLGDGKIKYVLARVDTRLLHGQVATGWTHSTHQTVSSLFLTLFVMINFVQA